MNWLIFAGDKYYPAGGWDDFRTRAGSLAEALDFAALLLKSWDWAHVVDAERDLQIEVVKQDCDNFEDNQPCWMGSIWDQRPDWPNNFLHVSK